MVTIMCVGLFFIILAAVVNLIELQKFLKALALLNECTITSRDKLSYIFRFIRLLPMLSPLIPDAVCVSMCAIVGFSGGLMVGILTLGGTCIVTLGIKFFLWLFRPKNSNSRDFNREFVALKQSWA